MQKCDILIPSMTYWKENIFPMFLCLSSSHVKGPITSRRQKNDDLDSRQKKYLQSDLHSISYKSNATCDLQFQLGLLFQWKVILKFFFWR